MYCFIPAIHFEVQIFPKLASGSLVKLTPVSFWLASISFREFLTSWQKKKKSVIQVYLYFSRLSYWFSTFSKRFQWGMVFRNQDLGARWAPCYRNFFCLQDIWEDVAICSNTHTEACVHTYRHTAQTSKNQWVSSFPPFCVCISFPPQWKPWSPLQQHQWLTCQLLQHRLDTFGIVVIISPLTTNLLSIAWDCFLN